MPLCHSLSNNGKVSQKAAVLTEQIQNPRLILSVRTQGETVVSEERSACQSEKKDFIYFPCLLWWT